MGAVIGIAMAVFGLIWTFGAVDLTAGREDMVFIDSFGMGTMEKIFPLFGVVFVVVALAIAIYNFKNATGKNRYSEFDIVEGDEEPDPLNERFGEVDSERTTWTENGEPTAYCPYCGKKVDDDYAYCSRCGKKLPGQD